jgi:hypothetical protein
MGLKMRGKWPGQVGATHDRNRDSCERNNPREVGRWGRDIPDTWSRVPHAAPMLRQYRLEVVAHAESEVRDVQPVWVAEQPLPLITDNESVPVDDVLPGK